MSLKEYQKKRNFTQTPEPSGSDATKEKEEKPGSKFVIQLHDASHLHYDFRIEIDGLLYSWALPRGPTMNASDPKMAVETEPHPMEYGDFEGIIPKGNYGAGTVLIWDKGTYIARKAAGDSKEETQSLMKTSFEKGHLTICLDGHRLKGEFALVKMK